MSLFEVGAPTIPYPLAATSFPTHPFKDPCAPGGPCVLPLTKGTVAIAVRYFEEGRRQVMLRLRRRLEMMREVMG